MTTVPTTTTVLEWRNASHPTIDGPWADEPDKMQWIDEATGLDCLIVRNGMGALCGYVGVPPEHPWHGVEYGDHLPIPCAAADAPDDYCDAEHSPESCVSVHGGLTFSARCRESTGPESGICHVPPPGRPGDIWWFGFDCAHSGDLTPLDLERSLERNFAYPFTDPRRSGDYRDVAYVRAEVASMAGQIAAALPSDTRCPTDDQAGDTA